MIQLYINPGAGSLLIQVLIGVAVSVLMFFKKHKISFKQLF
jgi:hypothetical protein